MVRIITIYFFLTWFNMSTYGQKTIELSDTVKLTGVLLCDSIQQECYFIVGLINTDKISKTKIRKLIRKKDYIYIDRSEVIFSILRREGIRINFCISEKTSQYTIKGKKKYYDRYFFIPIIDDWFIVLNINGRKKGITLKCW